ncbi:hypothetical protein TALK_13980 [Thalassospira alkalitolerans]|uniref:N-acetyltransferase domain-containing protein n=2 Tax=Thalassospira alkalitolerans TaxID=1293890 RepID=A0A1Y2LAR8_9PROT|nr:hypothetical protein TALK_13980 [Thalassospira alkalitolerans]
MMQTGLSFDRWREFVAEFCVDCQNVAPGAGCDDILWQRPRGIMVISNERGYIHGLFSYQVRDDIAEGLVLHVDNVMAVEIVSRPYVLDTMRDAMNRLVHDHRCAAVHVSLGEMDERLRDYFSGAGFVPRKIRYCAPATPMTSA